MLAGKVDQLLNDPQMREIFSRTARETIVENYDLRTHFLPQAMACVERPSRPPVKTFLKNVEKLFSHFA